MATTIGTGAALFAFATMFLMGDRRAETEASEL